MDKDSENKEEVSKKPSAPQPVEKKSSKGCCIALGIGGFLILAIFGWLFIVPFIITMRGSDTEKMDKIVDEALKPNAERQYQYDQPSTAAASRTLDCSKLFKTDKLPRNNPLCLNLYKTSAAEIQQKIDGGSYDRVVLYGNSTIMDMPSKFADKTNMAERIYNVAKFSDLITLPKIMDLFGLTDLNSFQTVMPYKAIYYRLADKEEAAGVCGVYPDGEKIGACALGEGMSIVSDRILDDNMSLTTRFNAASAPTNMFYTTKWPINCYTDETFMHETAHNFINSFTTPANKGIIKWFNEQAAGFTGKMGADLVCGDNTNTQFKVKIDGKEQKDYTSIVKFLGIFPSSETSHEYPTDNTCNQAGLTQWYRNLDKGDWQTQFKKFFADLHNSNIDTSTDAGIIKFIQGESTGDPKATEFLTSNGCKI